MEADEDGPNSAEENNLPYSLDAKLKDLSISDIRCWRSPKPRITDVIIMDEPTSAISDKKMSCSTRLGAAQPGLSVIYISHKLDEVFEIADEITVMRDGKVIETRPANQFDRTL